MGIMRLGIMSEDWLSVFQSGKKRVRQRLIVEVN